METFRIASETSRRSKDISTAQLVKVYIELQVPGEWRALGDRLYKGDTDLARREYLIRSALSEYLLPDTVIEFGVGAAPVTEIDDSRTLAEKIRSILVSLFQEGVTRPGIKDLDHDPHPSGPESEVPPAGAGPGQATASPADMVPRTHFDKPSHPFSTEKGAGIVVNADAGVPIGWIMIESDVAVSASRGNRAKASFAWSLALFDVVVIAILSILFLRLSKPIDVIAQTNALMEERNLLLSNISKTDPLTGLLNRRGVEDAVADAKSRGSSPSFVAFVDIDHFKAVNDRLGHEGGDRVLVAVASSLSGGVRQQDICGRWGGEEFVLALYGQSEAGALSWAERARSSIEALSLEIEGIRLGVTVTIGLAAAGTKAFPDARASADAAMYRGKEDGRNRVVPAGFSS